MSGAPESFAEYLRSRPPRVRVLLRQVRAAVRGAVPGATEGISYGIPAFFLGRPLIWFAAFKGHIGMYPPISGNPALAKAAARYAGPKGSLRFPLDEPLPLSLIARIARHRARQVSGSAAPRRKRAAGAG